MGNARTTQDLNDRKALARCPVCDRANRCARASGGNACECNAAVPELGAWLRERGLGDACVCRTCATEGARSPCTLQCGLDPVTRTCAGCRRTVSEISDWPWYSPVERARVVLRLRGVDVPH